MRKVVAILLLAALASALGGLPSQAQRRTQDEYDRRVFIVNARSAPMARLYVARSTTSGWEENILSHPLAPGTRILINFDDGTGSCNFDIRAVFKDRQMVQSWNINVCVESAWVAED